MSEPTITCPNCKTEIRLTESLAAPLITATRQQFERQLAQEDEAIVQVFLPCRKTWTRNARPS